MNAEQQRELTEIELTYYLIIWRESWATTTEAHTRRLPLQMLCVRKS
jgi:hypothetical protein